MNRYDQLQAVPDLMNQLKLCTVPVTATGPFFSSAFVTFPVLFFCQNPGNLNEETSQQCSCRPSHCFLCYCPCNLNAKECYVKEMLHNLICVLKPQCDKTVLQYYSDLENRETGRKFGQFIIINC